VLFRILGNFENFVYILGIENDFSRQKKIRLEKRVKIKVWLKKSQNTEFYTQKSDIYLFILCFLEMSNQGFLS
jgi:hypothetical protein